MIRFSVSEPQRCLSQRTDAKHFAGTGFRVEGKVQAPTALSVRSWPFESPRMVLKLPNVGGIPGISDSTIGAFRVPPLSRNDLMRAPRMIVDVSGIALDVPGLIESARPSVTAEPQMAWRGNSGSSHFTV